MPRRRVANRAMRALSQDLVKRLPDDDEGDARNSLGQAMGGLIVDNAIETSSNHQHGASEAVAGTHGPQRGSRFPRRLEP